MCSPSFIVKTITQSVQKPIRKYSKTLIMLFFNEMREIQYLIFNVPLCRL